MPVRSSLGQTGGASERMCSCRKPSTWPSSWRSTPTRSNPVLKYDGSMSTRRRLTGSVGKKAAAMKAPFESICRTGKVASGRIVSLSSRSLRYSNSTPQVSTQSCVARCMLAATSSYSFRELKVFASTQ